MKPRPYRTRSDRVEGLVLVTILLIVAGFAGAASFTHVKDWTLDNSPPGTGDWFGWANAAISELIPAAALLTIRRRRRTGGSIGYPMFLLVCAVSLSLAAQLAVAKPGVSGWLLSAVPALAFLGLSKLVLTTKPAPAPAPMPVVKVPAPVEHPAPVAAPVPPVPTPPVQQAPEPMPPVERPAAVLADPVPAPVEPIVRVTDPDPAEPVQLVRPVSPAPQPALFDPVRPPALAPVVASAFTRHNGTSAVTR